MTGADITEAIDDVLVVVDEKGDPINMSITDWIDFLSGLIDELKMRRVAAEHDLSLMEGES